MMSYISPFFMKKEIDPKYHYALDTIREPNFTVFSGVEGLHPPFALP